MIFVGTDTVAVKLVCILFVNTLYISEFLLIYLFHYVFFAFFDKVAGGCSLRFRPRRNGLGGGLGAG